MGGRTRAFLGTMGVSVGKDDADLLRVRCCWFLGEEDVRETDDGLLCVPFSSSDDEELSSKSSMTIFRLPDGFEDVAGCFSCQGYRGIIVSFASLVRRRDVVVIVATNDNVSTTR